MRARMTSSWLLAAMLSHTALAADSEFFERQIRPILQKNCLVCHSTVPSGGLRLDSRESVIKGGDTGPAVIPGNADGSLLIQAVRRTHGEVKMPPAGVLQKSEIDALVRWVNDGVAWPADRSAPAKRFAITAEQRALWSLQSPKDAPPPPVTSGEWSHNAIDRFLAAQHEAKGLKPAGVASRRAWIRRATYDLTGLPPTVKETEDFIADTSRGAYEKVVDRLLESPRYGERWGRHWLDLVRYADTAGDTADFPVPQAYLYRDYVVKAFQRDKPYDQFLMEQIAGDLMPAKSDADRWEKTVATGYLAVARRFGFDIDKYMHLTIDDTIDTLGKSMLGLSVACARCHDHKYDPISNRDYYALYGIFSSTRYPYPGCESHQTAKDFSYRDPHAVEALLKPARTRLEEADEALKKLTEEKKAVDSGQSPNGSKSADKLAAEIADAKNRRLMAVLALPDLERAYGVSEGAPRDANILRRGEPTDLGETVPRGFLEILGGQKVPAEYQGSGRLYLAQWIADPANPLTARVMVNRIWQHHFGRGIVATPNDFGMRGQPPTHPQLLDYLTVRFRESGWSVKAMHRLIMTSRAYRMAGEAEAANAAIDPENRWLWKYPRRRLDAESIRDSLLVVSGQLDDQVGGPNPFPHPAAWTYTQHRPFVAINETRRRSLYLTVQRTQREPLFALFDGADPNTSTPDRSSSTTSLQALFFMNSEFLHRSAEAFARRLLADRPDADGRFDLAYRLALGRPPEADEVERSRQFLAGMAHKLESAGVEAQKIESDALSAYLAALLSSNEFLFVD